jgi:hypothetical protein
MVGRLRLATIEQAHDVLVSSTMHDKETLNRYAHEAAAFALREHVNISGRAVMAMGSLLLVSGLETTTAMQVLSHAVDLFLDVTRDEPLTPAEEAAMTPEGWALRANIRARQAASVCRKVPGTGTTN